MSISFFSVSNPPRLPLGRALTAAATSMHFPIQGHLAALGSASFVQVGEEVMKYRNSLSMSYAEGEHTTLSTAVTATDTTLTVASTEAYYVDATYPTQTIAIGGTSATTTVERVTITAVVNATTLTVTRGVDGTIAAAHTATTRVWHPEAGSWIIERGAEGTAAKAHPKGAEVARLYTGGEIMLSAQYNVPPISCIINVRETVDGAHIPVARRDRDSIPWNHILPTDGTGESSLFAFTAIFPVVANALIDVVAWSAPTGMTYVEVDLRMVADAGGVPLPRTSHATWNAFGKVTTKTSPTVGGTDQRHSIWEGSDVANASFRRHATATRYLEVLTAGFVHVSLMASKN